MSVSSISNVPSVDPKRDLLTVQPRPAAPDRDHDGDNDKAAPAAGESRERSSMHKVDVRV